uniref:Uncharacterized protein n=1 Tax=Anguilla anguilla TaxID=7936 RepID=A0A0E9WDY1_ANGAN
MLSSLPKQGQRLHSVNYFNQGKVSTDIIALKKVYHSILCH